jgi:hypothetical protein
MMTIHDQTLVLANSLPAWFFNMLLVCLVFFQAFIYGKISLQYSKKFDVSSLEMKKALKSGIITTLGPALSIFIVGLGLLSQIGAPLTMARLSIIGNASYEESAAEFGAAALGTSISAQDYSMIAYTCSVWVMNLGGCCMTLMPLLLTKPLSTVRRKVGSKGNLGKIIGISASLASFGYFSIDYAIKGNKNLAAVLVAFLSMMGFSLIAKKYKIAWLREWSLGFSIIISVCSILLMS